MEITQSAKRVSFIRKVGWLSVASMLSLALLAPAANAQTGHPDNQSWDSVTQDCTGGPNGDITPQDGMVAWVFVHTQVDGPGTLTANFETAGTLTADSYVQGTVKYIIWTGPDTLLTFSDNLDTTKGTDQLVLSHVCAGQMSTTSSSTESSSSSQSSSTESSSTQSSSTESSGTTETSTTDQSSSTESSGTTETSTTDQSTSTQSTGTTETSTSGTQSVEAETDAPTPAITLPPTDTLSGPSAPSTDSWRILLIAGAALLASVLVLSPAKASRRR